jgi:hypothetical protein
MAMAIFAMATPALSLQPSLPLHNVMLHPCFSTPLRFKARSGTGIFCVLQQQQQRKEHHDRYQKSFYTRLQFTHSVFLSIFSASRTQNFIFFL